MNPNRVLYIIRGIPGSGKTTLAKSMTENHVAADDWFDKHNDGKFDPKHIKHAHKWCRDQVEEMMISGSEKIAVNNTFTQGWEMDPYIHLAEEYGYMVFFVVVENRFGTKSIHGVPQDKINQMRDRFELSL